MKSASKNLITNHLNNDNKTAEELFAAANEQLHQDAKEWLMRTTENCTILSVFIATVAFAAAYTVPGGPNQDTGIPILHSKPFFLVFILADVISLTLALTSVGIFFSILTSSFPLEDFKTYLFKKLKQGVICLVVSVTMMAVAFGATIVLIMTKNFVWDVVAFLPVPIFFLSCSPLRSLILGPCREPFQILVVSFVSFFYLLFLFLLFFGGICMFCVVCVLYFPIFIIHLVSKGLIWILKKAGECITKCKRHRWISGNKSQFDIQSPQPTAASPTHHV